MLLKEKVPVGEMCTQNTNSLTMGIVLSVDIFLKDTYFLGHSLPGHYRVNEEAL